jgi:hypothetical protein
MSEELVRRIGKMRVEAELAAPEEPPAREELNIVDAAIRVAAGVGSPEHAASRAERAKRKQALINLAPGASVTVADGDVSIASTAPKKPTRAQALDKLKAQLQAIPEEKRYDVASAAREKWSGPAVELLDEAMDDLIAESTAGAGTFALPEADDDGDDIDFDNDPDDDRDDFDFDNDPDDDIVY